MGSLTSERLEARLHARLDAFLNRENAWRPALKAVEEASARRGWRLFLFGGALRDLCMARAVVPRDLDFVVWGASAVELKHELADHLERQTRFGGLRLRIGGLPVDIWPLEQTWALAKGLVAERGPEALPQTTFLSVEAAAVELSPRHDRAPRLFTQQFFESFQASSLEINLEENPYPALCVVRALLTLRRLEFSAGPRLARYLVEQGTRLPMEQFAQAQLAHYGKERLSRAAIRADLWSIEQQLSEGRAVVRLPAVSARRRTLFRVGSPALAPRSSSLRRQPGRVRR